MVAYTYYWWTAGWCQLGSQLLIFIYITDCAGWISNPNPIHFWRIYDQSCRLPIMLFLFVSDKFIFWNNYRQMFLVLFCMRVKKKKKAHCCNCFFFCVWQFLQGLSSYAQHYISIIWISVQNFVVFVSISKCYFQSWVFR